MFVKTTTKRSGEKTYTYLSMVEAVRVGGKVTHKTLFRLGEVSDLRQSGQLERVIAALQAHVGGPGGSADVSCDGALSFGAIACVHAYFKRLGLDQHFGVVGKAQKASNLSDTIFVMLANRLLTPSSKRRTILEWVDEVALPDGVASPSLDQCYRALDALCASKDETEHELYGSVTDLTNLDLRLCCYDLTSTYFETAKTSSTSFPLRAYGYSRDKRGDRPQVMIGLLVTGDGIPIAHHVFAGNTNDAATLEGVMTDLQKRFGVGKIALVADRGLISEKNLDKVHEKGFDHVMATKLHRNKDAAQVLKLARAIDALWLPVPSANSAACEVTHKETRYVVVASLPRFERDNHRREELLSRTKDKLIALEQRVEKGNLPDPSRIGAAADRILRDSGVGRCFTTTIFEGNFSWDFDQEALDYETNDLAGRYVLTTSLTEQEASTEDIVRHYRMLLNVERRFRVMKDFLALRPVFHHSESRVKGHIALCVIASVIEALIGIDLERAGVKDPNIEAQGLSPRRCLRELERIKLTKLNIGSGHADVITKRSPRQHQMLEALHVDSKAWEKPKIS